jgi:tetratricopeptide (TPR) repeat protein
MKTKNIMRPKTLIPISLLFMLSATCFSQQTKQTIKTGNSTTQLTTSETGMYAGTKSKDAKTNFDKASKYDIKKDYLNSKKYYLLAIKYDTNYVEAYDNAGLACRRLEQYDSAIYYYKRSIALYPKGITAHQNLAAVYGLKKDYTNAAGEFEEIIKLEPDNPEGYFGLADTYMMQSKFDEALTNAKKALQLYESVKSPLVGDAQYVMGLIYYYQGDDKNAKTYLKSAKKHGAEIDPEIAKKLKI